MLIRLINYIADLVNVDVSNKINYTRYCNDLDVTALQNHNSKVPLAISTVPKMFYNWNIDMIPLGHSAILFNRGPQGRLDLSN